MSPELESLLESSGWVKRLARSLVGDPHTADDLVQEAWVIALERRPEATSGPKMKRWLAAVLRNLARDRRRGDGNRRAREHDNAASESDGSNADGPGMLDRLETHQRIVVAVRELDEPYRTAVVLRYFEDLKPTDIARQLDVPARTVHSRLHRGLAKLRERLRADFGDEGRGAWLLALLPLSERGPGWAGALPGVLIMDAKLKVAAAGLAVAGIAAVASVNRDSVEPAAIERQTAEVPLVVPADDESAVELAAPSQSVQRAVAAEEPAEVPATHTVVAAPEDSALELLGRVVDVHGRPVPGLDVEIRDGQSDAANPRATAGADGSFTMPLTTRSGQIVAVSEDYTTVFEPMLVGFSSELIGDSDPEVLVVVAPRQALGGMVMDLGGNPIAGARVAIDPIDDLRIELGEALERSRIASWTATSGADGRFEIANAPRLENALVVTRSGGYAVDTRPLPLQPTSQLEIVLGEPIDDTFLLEGRVVDSEGNPVEGAFVAIEFASGKTDGKGHFAMRLRGAGQQGVLKAIKRGMRPAILERSGDSNAAPGAWPNPLVLTLGGAPLRIGGRVEDASGKPLEGLRVWTTDTTHFGAVSSEDLGPRTTVAGNIEALLRGERSGSQNVNTDAQGRFELTGLIEKDYRISILDESSGVFHRTEPIPAGLLDVKIRMPEESRYELVAGRVVGFDGEAVPGARVALSRLINPKVEYFDGIDSATTTSDDDGRFEFKDVSTSMTHVRVQGTGLDFGNDIAIPPGADVEDLEVVVARRCRVRVELANPEEANGFTLLDADGELLLALVYRGDHAWSAPRIPLVEGRCEPVSASERAATLVLYDRDQEVRRAAITLSSTEVNVIRL